MAWRIHDWDGRRGCGTVIAPHFGPLPFGPGENPVGTADFEAGEEVRVRIDRRGDGDVVRSVTAARRRQPEGTSTPALAALNARRHGDLYVEDQTETSLRLWLGDCCTGCGPAVHVTFRDVVAIHGSLDDLERPWFRVATPAEVQEHRLAVPPGADAFCLVLGHDQEPEPRWLFIVAGGLEAEPCPPPPAPSCRFG